MGKVEREKKNKKKGKETRIMRMNKREREKENERNYFPMLKHVEVTLFVFEMNARKLTRRFYEDFY